ncbi:uncharacterized protein rab11fip5a isoform X2 [Halichoeres trimaculatus]|uniref:uncharacterized protein rab11fip5a isoform X2 n=1 Tax=Halichoeres trimaculatus TaxID=147232 RepID=UPI003D9EC711
MSSLTVEEDQKWVPTHVQVTVLRGRGLRGKGKHGTSDVYTIIQVGKEKYSTGVAEKTTEPEWKEECSFELQPGVLESDGRSGYPAGSSELVLTVMHRALIGLDVFLGQAVIQLDKIFRETRCVKNEWYRLNSKTGKKEKERGDIQVTVQFTRNNLTASMYDLVMKDKTASTFGKLKERMKGKRRSSEEDSSSAVLPGGYGSLYRMRQRLPSDGGGEEDYEDDEGGEVRRSKMRTFFLRGKLRKSSDTRSSTSLGSESSESSSRGGSLSPTAGISVVVSDLSNSPSNSSNLTVDNSPEHTADTSPKLSPLKSEYGDEVGEISIPVPQPTVYVNGSHAHNVQPLDPGSGKPVDSFGLGLLQKSLPLSMSLQNLSPHTTTTTALPKGPAGDGRRWSFDKPDEEEKAAIAAALEKSGPMLGEEEERLEQAAPHKEAASSSSSSTAELESQGKKQRRNLFSHGRSESAGKGQSQSKDESEHVCAAAEEKHRGWFGSKDAHSKPRPPISHLFPHSRPDTEGSDPGWTGMEKVERRPLPPVPTEGEKPFSKKSANPFTTAGELDPEWDESFEAFAAGRLQSPEDLTTDCKTQQNTPSDHPVECCSSEGASLHMSDADQNTNVNEALHHHHHHHQPWSESVVQAHKLNSNTHHFDTFAQFLETIPEHTSFESETLTLSSPDHAAFSDANQANVTDTLHSSVKLNSSSPDPGSSGLGSSTEEDFLSCLSSYSDKFSASSSEEAEAHNFEGNVLCFEKTSEAAVTKQTRPSESEDDFTDRSGDLSLGEFTQRTVIQEDLIGLDESVTPQWEDTGVPNLAEHPEAVGETGIENQGAELIPTSGISSQSGNCDEKMDTNAAERLLDEESAVAVAFPKPNVSLQSDGNVEKGLVGFDASMKDFTEVLNDSPESLTHCPTPPSLRIITSSPDPRSSDLPNNMSSETQDALRRSPVHFELLGDFLSSPSQGTNDTLLHSSDKSNSSFFQSLYVSTDSQAYQTCVSESNETLNSADATIVGEMSGSRSTDGASSQRGVSSNASGKEIRLVDGDFFGETSTDGSDFPEASNSIDLPSEVSRESDLLFWGKLKESHVTVGDSNNTMHQEISPNDQLQRPNAASPTKANDCLESQRVVSGESLGVPLQRSHSEGSLTPAFEELLLPSFGSDPGAIQESSPAQPSPDLPSMTSFPSSLTSDHSSSPVALSSLPFFADAPPSSPPSVSRAAAPKPAGANQDAPENSPHLVKPLNTATPAEEKRTEGRSVLATGLEKLKSTIHPGRSSQISEQEPERKKSLTEGAGSYYHLNHSELVALLVQREAELQRQKAEFERQKLLLAKREVELKKLKPQVKDLEDYIDTLLVRIMEQKPTLLQVRSKLK